MKHLVVIKLIFILCQCAYAQKPKAFDGWERMTYTKDTIHIELKKEKSFKCINKEYLKDFKNFTDSYKSKFFSRKEKGMVFKVYCDTNSSGSFLFKETSKSDTLCLWHLKDYKMTSIDEVNLKIKDFRTQTHRKLPPKKTDKLYQFYHNNDLFETYIIEILEKEDKFVIYPVIWRNQGNIEINKRYNQN